MDPSQQLLVYGMTAFGTIVSAMCALFVVMTSWRSVSALRGSGQLAAYRDFVLQEYVQRKVGTVILPERPERGTNELRVLRAYAMRALKTKEEVIAWHAKSSLKESGWHNQTAYEVADALQNLGVTTFTGSIPLRTVLATVGDVIVDDWLLCYGWVESYRKDQDEPANPLDDRGIAVGFHRRHGEWLALIAMLWMRNTWKYSNSDMLVDAGIYTGWDEVKSRLLGLCNADGVLLPRQVRHQVGVITGIHALQSSRLLAWIDSLFSGE